MTNHWRRNPAYWGTAGAGILPLAWETGRFLVSLRSLYVNEPHTWGIIGGKIDGSESPAEAALREFYEETDSGVEVQELIQLYVFRDKKVDFSYYNFLGILESEFEPEENWETEAWAWLTLDELLVLHPKHFGLKALLENKKALRILEDETEHDR